MRRLFRWLANGLGKALGRALCLLSLLACLGVAWLWVRGGRTQDYVVAARPSGRWWLAGSGRGGFVLMAWRGEPARVSPHLYSCPAAAAPWSGPVLLGLSPRWRALGFRGASGSRTILVLSADRAPSKADLDRWRRRHDLEPGCGLQAECDGPWPGWFAFKSNISGSGWVWILAADSCTELDGPLGAAAGVTAVPPLLWLALRSRRLYLRRRRRRLGLCLRCGYDLRGNASGRCSECGESIGGARPNGG